VEQIVAGDWIPMRLDLAQDPAVIGIAEQLRVKYTTERLFDADVREWLTEDLVVGKLHRLWAWASAQSRDGHAAVTVGHVDRMLKLPGFAAALIAVGWLEDKTDAIAFPNWEHWLSQSAKARVLNTRRKQKQRARQERDAGVTEAGPQQQQEDSACCLPRAREEGFAAVPAGGSIQLLVRAGFSPRAARRRASEFSEHQIMVALEKLAMRMKSHRIPNPQGYLLTLLRENGKASA